MATIDACGVVQPDYSGCCLPVSTPSVPEPEIITGPQGPPGPQGPQGPEGPQGPPGDSGSSCPLFCGTGSPEGVVSSPVGGPYEQTDATSTTHPLWVKRTGTGNNGWRSWAGLRGSAAGSFEIGDNALATGIDAIALGENTTASGLRSEAIGKSSSAVGTDAKAWGAGATATGDQSISIGDGNARGAYDILHGWGHQTNAAMAFPNFVFGKSNTIGTTADSSSLDSAQWGGHTIFGTGCLVDMGPSHYAAVVAGRDAKSYGRATVVIGRQAESRATDIILAGLSEGHFAVIIGDLAKGSGGCIVAIGDQADVRGDNTLAVGTHTRANASNSAAVGPSAFAGPVTGVLTPYYASAYGYSAQALGINSSAYGTSSNARAVVSGAFGTNTFIDALHEAATALGYGATTTTPRSLMIGGNSDDGSDSIYAIHFNGSPTPAFLVGRDGTVQLNDAGGSSTSRQLPVTANVVLGTTERVMTVNATSGAKTVTMPISTSVTNRAKVYVIKTDSSGNSVTILPTAPDTIDGSASFVLTGRNKYALLDCRNGLGRWDIYENN